MEEMGRRSRGSGVQVLRYQARESGLDLFAQWFSTPCLPYTPTYTSHTYTTLLCFKKLYSIEVNNMVLEPNCLSSNLGLISYGLCDLGQVT